MAVRSKRLFGPVGISTTVTTVYTCPAGETAIVKDLWVWPNAVTVTGLDLFINGSAAGNHIAHIVMPNSQDARVLGAFLTLADGDILRMGVTGTGNCTVSGHGAELEGLAD
jgi:hypothetical protein